MELKEAIRQRHSVRQYKDAPIEDNIRDQLNEYAFLLSEQGGLNIQIVYDEPECFNVRLARYGHFENVKNYVVISGKKEKDLEERAGYYGELFVLKAQTLGLNTCWVALTHGKSRAVLKDGEKEVILISLGYGESQGVPHKNKDLSVLSPDYAGAPDWFKKGVDAALKAPTATNQQKFRIALKEGNKVKISTAGIGPYLKLDLGIVKCHFELGAGKENVEWA